MSKNIIVVLMYHGHKLLDLIYLSIYLSMALQTFCWTLAAFSVPQSIHSRKDSLDGESTLRKTVTYTQNNTNTE
jgi:hypothetical protein